nr:hypothetical protein Itr_chr02CG17690 [Ipomoea trifida]
MSQNSNKTGSLRICDDRRQKTFVMSRSPETRRQRNSAMAREVETVRRSGLQADWCRVWSGTAVGGRR